MYFSFRSVQWACQALCVLLPCLAFQSEAEIFAHELRLKEFGAIPNMIPTLQKDVTMGIEPFKVLRTNDYQNLQLNYGNSYKINRTMMRMGAFQNSQSTYFYANVPPGPALTFPIYVFSDQACSPENSPIRPNPAAFIATDPNNNRIAFSAKELEQTILPPDPTPPIAPNDNSIAAAILSKTGQAMSLTYTVGSSPNGSIIDYNVIGSAFHDMQYTNFTPMISSNCQIVEVTVFTENGPETESTSPSVPKNVTLNRGNKLKVTFAFNQHDFTSTQTWLFYFQDADGSDSTKPPRFDVKIGTNPSLMTAQETFSGFIRAAIIQTDPVPFFLPVAGQAHEIFPWAASIGIQTIAPSPAALFALWPVDFVKKATQKIEYNFQNFLPNSRPTGSDCDPECKNSACYNVLPWCLWLSVFLPILAREDFSTANSYLSQLVANASSTFDFGTNPFLTYVYMNLARVFASDISCYQSSQRPFPNNNISATSDTVETVYDAHRSAIPTNAEISFQDGYSYSWAYKVVRSSSSTQNPLILFPRYKTLQSPYSPLPNYLVNDPVKGLLYGVEGIQNQNENFVVTFQEPPLPKFLDEAFFPPDLWQRMNNDSIVEAEKYMYEYLNDPGSLAAIKNLSYFCDPLCTASDTTNCCINYPPTVYENGKVLYMAASTIRYATAFMTFLSIDTVKIRNKTQPFIDAIKNVMQDWLFKMQSHPPANKGYFIGDTTVGGICGSPKGMVENGDIFFQYGNAFYNDHHFQYGYWLGAAAAVIEWDNQYSTETTPETTPWIAQRFTSAGDQKLYQMKDFIDLLWRDTVNPDPDDPQFPYHRHGNPWEGHSTANGLPPSFINGGRNQESLAEDFNCWLGVLFYARAIQQTNTSFSGAFSDTQLKGFDTLENFCSTHLSMTATAGNLYYNTPYWPYANRGFNFNAVVGNQYDNVADGRTFFDPGAPPCRVCN